MTSLDYACLYTQVYSQPLDESNAIDDRDITLTIINSKKLQPYTLICHDIL